MRPDILKQQAVAAKHIKDALEGYDDPELTLDSIEGETDFLSILDQIMSGIADDEMMVEGIKSRQAELNERKERLSFRIEKRRKLVENALLMADLQKIERPEYTLSIRKGQQQLNVYDEGSIPQDYYKQPPPTLDRMLVRTALKDGFDVPGASLTNGQPSLSVRRK
jgi:hypothetical protein